MPVIVLLDDLELIKPEDINDPWAFFQELEALKRIEEDFKERMKVKTQAAIQHARQKDEAFHTRIHSKMPKRVSMQEETAEPITSDPTTIVVSRRQTDDTRLWREGVRACMNFGGRPGAGGVFWPASGTRSDRRFRQEPQLSSLHHDNPSRIIIILVIFRTDSG
ncbi:hypothetical protein ARMSODRAFT_1041172 [Armillaria solidipes]|uniref:Uncharacterized protein n=1 Tax=Armillaria solidipes TaxID=1076256 RepID=A0A2H3C3B7_9AGAR|nr:hypothetical protein ARMSODRAFT_1041172 [Armillaria solidipes]